MIIGKSLVTSVKTQKKKSTYSGPRIPLAKPVFTEDMKKAALDALTNERFVLGESVYKFEEEFAKYCGVDYAVSTSSGTNALQISLIALGVKLGDNVLTTPVSFVATSNAIIHALATPIFVDVNLKNYTLNTVNILKSIDRKTKVLLPVHIYGYPANMDKINSIADKNNLSVVEDACQAHGALYKNSKVGSLGDIGCFSFYSSKNMTVAGDGGMLITNRKVLAEKSAKLRDCGRRSQYIHDLTGYTSRLNNVNAAIGRVQLKHLDEWNRKRRVIAGRYDNLLSDISEVDLPPKENSSVIPVYHLYVIRTKYRDQLKAYLEKNGIQCGIHYPIPIHLQPIYQELYGFKQGTYPNSEQLCMTCLSLPMFPELSSNQLEFVSEKVHNFFSSSKK